MLIRRVVFTIGFCVCAAAAEAAQINYSSFLDYAPTNSSRVASLPKFDPALGDLESISLYMNGSVLGTARYESFNATPRTVTLNLGAEIELQQPDMDTLAVSLPLISFSDNASAYDGVFDYDGASGGTFANLSASASVPLMEIPLTPENLAYFVGMGTVDFPVIARGASSGSGGGNIIFRFETLAAAEVGVQYKFREIPEPATAALVGIAVALARRRRR